MSFTGLHRALGVNPGPLSSEMVDQAVAAGVIETDDLDWKRELPPERNLTQTDFPKDVAAMANAGGGVIVYGIEEVAKAATKRLDVGSLSETHARALRSAAVTGISPPIFGLDVVELGEQGSRVVAVVIPASVDVPHLIYRGEHFGAPVRNDADTVWMRERQIDAMYRARFTEQRSSHEALETLYRNAVAGRDISKRAWFVGVARPRVPTAIPPRLSRAEARSLAESAVGLALVFVDSGSIHPLDAVDRSNPRPGLRSWVLSNSAESERHKWREAWASLHDDGSVTLAATLGGHRTHEGNSTGEVIAVDALEAAIADLMSLIAKTSNHVTARDYDLRIGVEWVGEGPMTFEVQDAWDRRTSAALSVYTPILATLQTDTEPDDYYDSVYDLICDAVNQVGVQEPLMMSKRRESE
jgi:hypothetical protein